MIARRYPAILGGIAAGMLVLALAAAVGAADAAEQGSRPVFSSGGAVSDEQMAAVYAAWQQSAALIALAPWAVFGAALAGVAALVLLVLRARGQTGSASATASRAAATAASRS